MLLVPVLDIASLKKIIQMLLVPGVDKSHRYILSLSWFWPVESK